MDYWEDRNSLHNVGWNQKLIVLRENDRESWFRAVKYPKGKVSKMRKTFIFDFPESTLVTEYVKMFDEGNNCEDFYKDEAIKTLCVVAQKIIKLMRC